MDAIKKGWDENAERFGTSHCASWGDLWAIRLEIEAIDRHLQDGDDVLDAGCSNGYSLLEQVKRHSLRRAVGVDFSESMIKFAHDRKREESFRLTVPGSAAISLYALAQTTP